MAVKKFRPTTPSRRYMTVADYSILTKKPAEKSLTESLPKKGGRNNLGRVTVRFRGGGHKRLYRVIDFKRNKDNVPGAITAIEYDPNRSAYIALVVYADGDKKYILAPEGLKVGDNIVSGEKADIIVGNAMPIKSIPVGTLVHNIELKIGKGGQIARSAGMYAQVLAKEGEYAHLRMPSGEVRLVHKNCRATIGQVGNSEHENVTIGKAGRMRWLGKRPHVRGVAMNPIDHPMGGGEGRTSGGRPSCSPWGKPTKGYRTRKKNHRTDKYIVRRRNA